MFLQKFKRGRASTLESVLEILKPLTDMIEEERSNLSFSPTLRGWCYVLEGLGICSKGVRRQLSCPADDNYLGRF